jgi:DNA-binding NtrC family response regulator
VRRQFDASQMVSAELRHIRPHRGTNKAAHRWRKKPMPSKVYIVEAVPSLAEVYKGYLAGPGLEVSIFPTGTLALAAIEQMLPHVIVLDQQLPDMDGLDLLQLLKSRNVAAEVVVVSGQGSIGTAVSVMRNGAFDFVVKPCSAERLKLAVRNALDRRKSAHDPVSPTGEFARTNFAGFIGQSVVMQDVYRVVQSAAPTNATVFITGESGTGKEVCAKAIHSMSKRADGPFVTLNCGAIPRDLLESELFGHVKGAFTGAATDRNGAALMANGGTLFLDEICEMDSALQVKMLRFLQEKTVQRVGEDRTRQADVRIVCATNRDPAAEVAAGRFREDLFYRLHVIPIEIPALRQREEDVLLIAREFLKSFARDEGKQFRGYSPQAEKALLEYAWPGNVRQLQNTILNAVVLNDGETIELEMLPAALSETGRGCLAGNREIDCLSSTKKGNFESPVAKQVPIIPLEEVIRETIENAITLCDGSIPRAASALGVSPSTIYRRVQVWEENATSGGQALTDMQPPGPEVTARPAPSVAASQIRRPRKLRPGHDFGNA